MARALRPSDILGELRQADQRELSKENLGNPSRETVRDYWRRHGKTSLALE